MTLASLSAEASTCTRCPLARTRTQVVFGDGDPQADLVFIGEGPGADEDAAGVPFVGRSGRLLDRLIAEEVGVSRDACYILNIVKCRPPANRDPRPEEAAACRGWLEAQLDLIAPRVIVTLGNVATRSYLGTTEGITRVRGREYPAPDGAKRAIVIPTYHPAAALRGTSGAMAAMRADLVRVKHALDAPAVPA